jgi:RNA polymerase sigma-70 factor (ECF subfamily)
VLRARDGCKTSFGALVRRYERGLFDFLRLRSRSIEDAEELVQESFLRAWEKLDLYDPRWSFGTWLYALARRLAAGRARRARVPEADQDAARSTRAAHSSGETRPRIDWIFSWERSLMPLLCFF